MLERGHKFTGAVRAIAPTTLITLPRATSSADHTDEVSSNRLIAKAPFQGTNQGITDA